MITKGITSVICDCFTDISLQEAKSITVQDIERLGIRQLLTAQRRNGLSSLVDNIQKRISLL
jgi:sulfur transfer protein SufE